MNYLILAIGFACVVLGVNGEDKHSALRQRCYDEVGLNRGEVAAAGIAAFMQNPKMKCYMKCFLEGVNAFDANNNFNLDRAASEMPPEVRERVQPLLSKCANESNQITEKCEKSYVATKCLYDAVPDIFNRLDAFEPAVTA